MYKTLSTDLYVHVLLLKRPNRHNKKKKILVGTDLSSSEQTYV